MVNSLQYVLSRFTIERTTALLFALTTVVIVLLYIVFHDYEAYGIVSSVVLGLVWLARWLFRVGANKEISIRGLVPRMIGFWHVIAGVAVLTLLMLVVLAIEHVGMPSSAVAARAIGRSVVFTISSIAVLVGIFFLCVAIGKKINTYFSFVAAQRSILATILEFGVGYIVCSFVWFGMLLLGVFSTTTVMLSVVGLLLISSTECKALYRQMFCVKYAVQSMSYSVDKILGWISLASVVLVSSYRILPVVNDDLAAYYTVPKTFVAAHSLVSFDNSIGASVGAIGHMWNAALFSVLPDVLAFGLNVLLLGLIVVVVYVFALNSTGSSRVAHITAVIACIVPWNSFFAHTQKLVFVVALFSLLAIALLRQWLSDRSLASLVLAGVCIGFVVSVKLSSLIVLVGVLAVVAILWSQKRMHVREVVVLFGVVVIVCLPTAWLHYEQHHSVLGPYHIGAVQEQTQFFGSGHEVTMTDLFANSALMAAENSVITQLTRHTIVFENVFANALWQLWNTAMNQVGFAAPYVQVGPFVLPIVVFALWLFVYKQWYQDETVRMFAVFFVTGFIAWFLVGLQRPWYGIGIFYMTFVFGSLVLKSVFAFVWARKIVVGTVYIFVGVFVLGTLSLAEPSTAAVISGTAQLSDVQMQHYWYPVAEAINQEIVLDSAAKILVIPGQEAAFVTDPHKHILASSYGFYWSQLIHDAHTQDDVSAYLREQGVTHIYYQPAGVAWLQQFDHSNTAFSLFVAFEQLEVFLERYGEEVYCGEVNNCLYHIQ